jgi:RecB family exonuclease
LADERRVFHVAVSRALRDLVVTAVASLDDDGPQPSRFVRDLCIGLDVDLMAAHTRGYPRRALNANGLVSSIRHAATLDTAAPATIEAAAQRLALLAALTDASGRALVHGANPDHWWAVRPVTVNSRPIHDPAVPVSMSATGLQAIEDCGLRRFFEKEAAANRPDTQPAAFGTVVHSIAEALLDKSLPAESAAVEAVIDAVWPQLASDAAWASAQERVEASDIATRLLDWHLADRKRVPIQGEKGFDVVVDVALPDGRADAVRLIGSIDRVEVDVDDPTGVHIVDFKTSRYAPVVKTLEQHPQLGVYRLIVEAGAVDDIVPNAHVAGAELVELRHVDKDGKLKIYAVSGPTDGTWPDRLGAAAAVVRDEVLEATPSDQVCRTCPLQRLCPAKSAGRQVLP